MDTTLLEREGRRKRLKNMKLRVRRVTEPRELPFTLRRKDWLHALQYFDCRCACCGVAFNDACKPQADHWIPLAALHCPGTIPTNIVPMCDDCNGGKRDADPIDWLMENFGQEEGEIILTRIHVYFGSLNGGEAC